MSFLGDHPLFLYFVRVVLPVLGLSCLLGLMLSSTIRRYRRLTDSPSHPTTSFHEEEGCKGIGSP